MKIPGRRLRISRSFYNRATATVARELLGKLLLRRIDHQWVGGQIVETEAYLPDDDLASHSARGCTPSNRSMFDRPGTLYVYPIHAKYCMNVVTEAKGLGAAVLIRAVEPIWGIDVMCANRRLTQKNRLTRGPAMTCQALAVDRTMDGIDMIRHDEIGVFHNVSPIDADIIASGRIGISKSQLLPLRYFVKDNPYVSGRRK